MAFDVVTAPLKKLQPPSFQDFRSPRPPFPLKLFISLGLNSLTSQMMTKNVKL